MELKQKLNLKSEEDWNSITNNIIQEHGGRELLRKYSLNEIKYLACTKQNSWDEDKIKTFVKQLKENLNLRTPEDWNSITKKQIKFLSGGSSIFKKYSVYKLKCLGCPEGKLLFDSLLPKPSGFWDKKENIHQFLLELKEKENIKTPKDWNLKITKKTLKSNGGVSLLDKYSIYDLKCLGCPEGKSLFDVTPKPAKYWLDEENVVQFLHYFGDKLNLKTPKDWNSITKKQIQSLGGGSLFAKYSLYELKCIGFPDGKQYFNLPPKPAKYWLEKDNVIQFLNDLSDKLNLKTPKDWNSITKKQIQSFGGVSLFDNYSMYDLKCLGCPEGKFLFDLSPKPPGYWSIEDNILQFLSTLKEKLNLNTVEDWERLSTKQIKSHGGSGLLMKYPIKKIIQFAENSSLELKNNKRSSQRWLFLQVQKLFPGEEIIEDYFHDELSRKAGSAIQFDIFLLNRKIAFEYHGKQHYEDIPNAGFSSIEVYIRRDKEKAELCRQFGIHLIIVPFWWDNSLDSLKLTLCAVLQE